MYALTYRFLTFTLAALALSVASQSGYAAIEWETAPMPVLHDAAWGNGRYVGVGGSTLDASAVGVAMTRLADDRWVYSPAITAQPLRDITWSASHSRFVAVGQDAIMSSPDGIQWTKEAPVVSGGLYGITVGEVGGQTQFVAVGESGKILTSPNGHDWMQRSLNIQTGIEAVTWNGELFVAVGATSFPGPPASIFTSSDGISWTLRPIADLQTSFYGVAWGNGKFVAVGSFGNYATSADGITWKGYCPACGGGGGQPVNWTDVAWTGTQFVAVQAPWSNEPSMADAGQIWTSADGVTWSSRLSMRTPLYGVASTGADSDTAIMAVGQRAWALTSDQFGISWTPRTGVTWSPLGSVNAHNGKAVVVGERNLDIDGEWLKGVLFEALDDTTWAYRHLPTGVRLRDAARSPHRHVAVGLLGTTTEGVVVSSDDGITWTPRAIPRMAPLESVAWGGTGTEAKFVAAGGMGIITSPDGINWTPVNVDGMPSFFINRVTWTGTRFVAACEDGQVMWSADGVSWTVLGSAVTGVGFGVKLTDITVAPNGRLVAVGWLGKIITSPLDVGAPWTVQTISSSPHLRGVTSNGRELVAVGDGGVVLVSRDGLIWSSLPSGITEHLRDVAWDGQRLIAVGDAGTILHGTDPDSIFASGFDMTP